jgi:hypothetical protein
VIAALRSGDLEIVAVLVVLSVAGGVWGWLAKQNRVRPLWPWAGTSQRARDLQFVSWVIVSVVVTLIAVAITVSDSH